MTNRNPAVNELIQAIDRLCDVIEDATETYVDAMLVLRLSILSREEQREVLSKAHSKIREQEERRAANKMAERRDRQSEVDTMTERGDGQSEADTMTERGDGQSNAARSPNRREQEYTVVSIAAMLSSISRERRQEVLEVVNAIREGQVGGRTAN